MDPKRSLTKFKTDKKLRRKRTDSQSSLPCLTEPNQPNKDSFRCSELPALTIERTSVDPVKVQKTVKEKEACALDYLRGMSDEESSQNEIERKMTNFDEDLDPLDTSDRLSPFFNATKRHTMHRENSLLLPSSTQMKFAKEIKPVVGKSGEGKRKGVGKRIHSDPDEKVRTKVTKSQSCQFTFYELPPKGAVNKVNIGTNFYEDTKGYRRTNSISERTIQNVMTEPDYQDITVPTQENYPKEVEIVMHTDHSSSSKGPSVLQIRRLIGNNYSHILHEMREYKENGIIKDMKSTNRVNHDKLEPGLTSSRKLYYPKEKRPPVPSSFRYGPNNIVLVGRGVPGLNNYGEFDTRKLSIEDTRERRKTSFSDHGDSKEMPYKDEVLKGMRSVSSAGTSRKNLRGDSEAGNITLSRCSRLRTPLNEVQNFKEDNSVFITRATNESPTCVTERESKGDVQVGFWFKAKKNLLNPPSPERESSMQEKGLYRGLNLPRKRETCKENKVLLDKVSQVYKFKMGNVTQQNGNLLSERSEITRAIHNIKDLNLFKKDQRVSSSLNRKKSFRENFSIDMKGLDGKAPKLRAILEVLQKELKGDRPSTPAKGRPNNTAENKPIKSDRARKGLDNLTNLLNMKGSEVKLRPSRFE